MLKTVLCTLFDTVDRIENIFLQVFWQILNELKIIHTEVTPRLD